MSRLHELAEERGIPVAETVSVTQPRPVLDIAMELLGRLPFHRGPYPEWHLLLGDGTKGEWHWFWQMSDESQQASGSGTITEAVVALAERAREGNNDA